MAWYMIEITRRNGATKYYGPFKSKKVANAKKREYLGAYDIPGRKAKLIVASKLPTIPRGPRAR